MTFEKICLHYVIIHTKGSTNTHFIFNEPYPFCAYLRDLRNLSIFEALILKVIKGQKRSFFVFKNKLFLRYIFINL